MNQTLRLSKKFTLHPLKIVLSLILGSSSSGLILVSPAVNAAEIAVGAGQNVTLNVAAPNDNYTLVTGGTLTIDGVLLGGANANSEAIRSDGGTLNILSGSTITYKTALEGDTQASIGVNAATQVKMAGISGHGTNVISLDNVAVTDSVTDTSLTGVGSALQLLDNSKATMTANTVFNSTEDTALETFNNATVTATGSKINGGYSGVTVADNSSGTLNNTTITAGKNGVEARDSALVNINGGTVTTDGSVADLVVTAVTSYGVGFSSISSPAAPFTGASPVINITNGAVVKATGANSAGLYSDTVSTQSGTINVTDSSISGGKYGLVMSTSGSVALNPALTSGLNTVNLTNSSLTSGSGDAIYVDKDTQGAVNILAGSKITAGNGVALETAANSQTSVTVNQSAVVGDAINNGGATSIALQNGASWTGGLTDISAVSVANGTNLNLTKTSSVAGDLTNAGTVSLATAPVGSTLTVGNYVGNNGNLVFGSALSDDNSVTDKLIVTGDTSGSTNVTVNNVGGTGAQTLNGIELIQVNGASNGTFTQSGRIVAGAYDYSLAKGTGANSGNLYLTSFETSPVIDPIVVPNDNVFRPEGGSYIANLSAANNMFVTRLYDRLGETRYTDPATGEQKETSLWLRQVGNHNSFSDNSGQLKTTSNGYVAQLGGDIAQGTSNGKNSWHLGLMAGYGNSHSSTLSSVSDYKSKGQVDGYSTGVYGTWFENDVDKTGMYVDTWAQYSWFNNTVNGDKISDESYKSKGITASLETGYKFKIGETGSGERLESYYIQPNAQAIWMGVKADDHTESNGTVVSGDGDNNVQTRVGARLSMMGHSHLDDKQGRSFQPFVEANWIHNTSNYGATMDGVSVTQAGTSNIGELKVGVEGKLSRAVELWGNVGQQIGDKSYSNTTAMLGIKYKF